MGGLGTPLDVLHPKGYLVGVGNGPGTMRENPTMKIDGREVTSAQLERQLKRGRDGKYSTMYPCAGGCGKSAGYNYLSHHLSDCLDAEGRGFGDAGLVLCQRCAKATMGQTTLREFGKLVAKNYERRGVAVPAYVTEWITGNA